MTDELRPEIAREINQVAHFGHAPRVRELVAGAAQAMDEDSYEGAAEALLEAKKRAPRSAFVRELLGLAYYRLGRWREAARELAAYRRLSDRRDRDPEYADSERALGRPEKAIEVLADLEEQELPEDIYTEGLIVRGGALADLGRFDDAVRALEKGPLRPAEVQPHHLRLWYSLADALEKAGNRRDARAWWDAIYADDPEFFDVADRRLGIRRS